jgi:hypothetical protein
MFDFQVAEDVANAKEVPAAKLSRQPPWMA